MASYRPTVVTLLVCVGLLGLLWLTNRVLPGDIEERIGVPRMGRLEKTEAEWQRILTPAQFRVTRQHGTEAAYSGVYWNAKDEGVYHCICCEQPLFDSKTKFDSGTGWPSYWEPIDENSVSLLTDRGWFLRRTEVLCSRCDAHLGHVFKDGPPPTGLRYCMNSLSLKLIPRKALKGKCRGRQMRACSRAASGSASARLDLEGSQEDLPRPSSRTQHIPDREARGDVTC